MNSSCGGGSPSKSITEATCMWALSSSRCRNDVSSAVSRSPIGRQDIRFHQASAGPRSRVTAVALVSRLLAFGALSLLVVATPASAGPPGAWTGLNDAESNALEVGVARDG